MNNIFKTSILVDNDSWILPHIDELISKLQSRGLEATLVRSQEAIPEGDACFILGCTNLVSPDILGRNRHNLVVHESALPEGKGFAPMAWSILAGNSEIPICLLEAERGADSGAIWIQDTITLDGYELCDTWREKQASKTIELCLTFVDEYDSLTPRKQTGEEFTFPRRTPNDSQLDLNKSILEQFNLLRVVDNQRYPAFVLLDGRKYRIEIFEDE